MICISGPVTEAEIWHNRQAGASKAAHQLAASPHLYQLSGNCCVGVFECFFELNMTLTRLVVRSAVSPAYLPLPVVGTYRGLACAQGPCLCRRSCPDTTARPLTRRRRVRARSAFNAHLQACTRAFGMHLHVNARLVTADIDTLHRRKRQIHQSMSFAPSLPVQAELLTRHSSDTWLASPSSTAEVHGALPSLSTQMVAARALTCWQ